MKKYEKLKTQYPAYVSLDQLRIICRIAKRTARYLVENNIIPAIDTGRKTWRYKISIDDVITYLRQREQRGSMIPVGAVNSRKTKGIRRRSYSQAVASGEEQEVVKYFTHIYTNYPDIITTHDMETMTGLHKKSFMRIIAAGHIKFLERSPKYIIPKIYFWEFIGSRRFIDAWSNSEDFIKVLESFEVWKQNR
jgi:hypothetical protein